MRTADNIKVTIQRVGAPSLLVEVAPDSTVETVLGTANIDLSPSENVYFNGSEVNAATAIVDDGDAIQIVQNKKGGTR